jgi:hypothetical protein
MGGHADDEEAHARLAAAEVAVRARVESWCQAQVGYIRQSCVACSTGCDLLCSWRHRQAWPAVLMRRYARRPPRCPQGYHPERTAFLVRPRRPAGRHTAVDVATALGAARLAECVAGALLEAAEPSGPPSPANASGPSSLVVEALSGSSAARFVCTVLETPGAGVEVTCSTAASAARCVTAAKASHVRDAVSPPPAPQTGPWRCCPASWSCTTPKPCCGAIWRTWPSGRRSSGGRTRR